MVAKLPPDESELLWSVLNYKSYGAISSKFTLWAFISHTDLHHSQYVDTLTQENKPSSLQGYSLALLQGSLPLLSAYFPLKFSKQQCRTHKQLPIFNCAFLVTVNPAFWTVLRPCLCSSCRGGPPKTDGWHGAAAVGHSISAQQHPEATQLVVGGCWAAATNPSQCVAHSWQQPCSGENTHTITAASCTSYPLLSPSMLVTSCPLPVHTMPSCFSTLTWQDWVSSPQQQPHNPSQKSILFLTSQVPPHTQTKTPPRCSHINLKFLLPKPPTL